MADPGNAQFHLTDPRGASDKSGRTFNNPYQYFFEQMHMDDAIYADESIYEYPMQQGGGMMVAPILSVVLRLVAQRLRIHVRAMDRDV